MVLSRKLKRELPLHLLLVPGLVLVIVFAYFPMFGIIMAFQNYLPAFGFLKSEWVGWDNFKYIFAMPDMGQILFNTIFIASMKIVFGTLATIGLALLLNEISKNWFKRPVQTIMYLPAFLSWIILGGMFRDILSLEGILNQFLGLFSIHPIMFLGDNRIFPFVIVITGIWQSAGFGTIIYLASISGIDPALYEAAIVDGAGRLRQTWHVTLPGMRPIIALICILNLGGILAAGFDQIFTLYGPLVYQSGDVIETWVYRTGLLQAQYSIGAAVGLFSGFVSFVLMSISYYLAYKFTDYRVF